MRVKGPVIQRVSLDFGRFLDSETIHPCAPPPSIYLRSQSANYASIGPPRERGGKYTQGATLTGTSTGFNWATPRTGWKGGGAGREVSSGLQASIGPPRERGGKSPIFEAQSQPRTLQLGHPANGVERSPRRLPIKYDRFKLQLGHPANGVERALISNSSHAFSSQASIGPPRERGGKMGIGGAIIRVTGMLQLGHPANGVESLRGLIDVAKERAASIGPPRERGGKHRRGKRTANLQVAASIGPPRERGGKFP